MASSILSLVAPAKINLMLNITGQEKQYHLFQSMVLMSASGDRISVEIANQDDLKITGPYASSLTKRGNSIVSAQKILKQAAAQKYPKRKLTNVSVSLEKNLPVFGGVGGGSSDAAATLLLLNRLWNLNFSYKELALLSLKLGADTPMCLHGILKKGAFWATHFGEKIVSLKRFPACVILLINNGVKLSTETVFYRYRYEHEMFCKQIVLPNLFRSFSELESFLLKQENSLYNVAQRIEPSISKVIDILKKEGASVSRMSGSGSTCFGLYPDLESARLSMERIKNQHPDWFLLLVPVFQYTDLF